MPDPCDAPAGDPDSPAWAAARLMTGAPSGHGRRPPGDLVATALRMCRTLSAGLGAGLPFTVLGPGGGGVRGLAAFLAVYATQQQVQDAQALDAAPRPGEAGWRGTSGTHRPPRDVMT
ncbi:hypothetical protein [Streptomyces coriariae]|uniref:hypothetical protein n=1 Tax=Streptomyces coriariae TaxID=2864460 RepID=UPI001E2B7044|nr:hypothetical protein [Streptomyces coriariae]